MGVRLALIGCGAAANKYYLPVLKENPEICRDLYLVDRDIDTARKAAESVGAVHCADDFRRAIGNVDGAIVAVPHHLHYSIATEFLRAKCHVLCEKPLAEKASEASEMAAEAQRHGVKLCVHNRRRIFPSFAAVKNLMVEKRVGEPVSISYLEAGKFGWESRTNFYINPLASDKGVLLDLGAHVMDLVCWWLDAKPELILCEDDSYGGPESLVHVKARERDCSIQIVLNRLINLESRFVIRGTGGQIEGTLADWRGVTVKDNIGRVQRVEPGSGFKTHDDMVRRIVENFLQVVGGIETPLVEGQDVIRSIEFIEECYRQRRRLPMPWDERFTGVANAE